MENYICCKEYWNPHWKPNFFAVKLEDIILLHKKMTNKFTTLDLEGQNTRADTVSENILKNDKKDKQEWGMSS